MQRATGRAQPDRRQARQGLPRPTTSSAEVLNVAATLLTDDAWGVSMSSRFALELHRGRMRVPDQASHNRADDSNFQSRATNTVRPTAVACLRIGSVHHPRFRSNRAVPRSRIPPSSWCRNGQPAIRPRVSGARNERSWSHLGAARLRLIELPLDDRFRLLATWRSHQLVRQDVSRTRTLVLWQLSSGKKSFRLEHGNQRGPVAFAYVIPVEASGPPSSEITELIPIRSAWL